MSVFYHFRTTATKERLETVITYFKEKFISYIIVRHKVDQEGEHIHILFYSLNNMSTQRQQIKKQFTWMVKTNYYLAQKDSLALSFQYMFHDDWELVHNQGSVFTTDKIAEMVELSYSKEDNGEIKSERKTQKESHLEFILKTFDNKKHKGLPDVLFKDLLYKHSLRSFGKKVKILDGSIINRHLIGALNVLRPNKVEKDLRCYCFTPDELYEINQYGGMLPPQEPDSPYVIPVSNIVFLPSVPTVPISKKHGIIYELSEMVI